VCVLVCVCACVWECEHMCVGVCMCVCVCACMCVCVSARARAALWLMTGQSHCSPLVNDRTNKDRINDLTIIEWMPKPENLNANMHVRWVQSPYTWDTPYTWDISIYIREIHVNIHVIQVSHQFHAYISAMCVGSGQHVGAIHVQTLHVNVHVQDVAHVSHERRYVYLVHTCIV